MDTVLYLTKGKYATYDCDINFYEPMKKIFPQVINYNYFERAMEIGEHPMNREIRSIVGETNPEIVFVHTFRNEIFKSTLKEITANQIPTVLWFSDDHWRFDNYSKYFGPVASYSVTTDHLAVEKYNRLKIPVILSQWAANPDYYRKTDCHHSIDVSFVGAKSNNRALLLEKLQSEGIQVETFGSNWPNGRVSFEEMIQIFSCSRINLNLSDYWGGPGYKQIKGRVFEVTMSGGLLLTEYVPFLKNYFDIGSEILCYESIEEAAALIKYYLSHEEEREVIAEAGYQRSLQDHTWKNRLETLFSEVRYREAHWTHHPAENDPKYRKTNVPKEMLSFHPSQCRILEAQVNSERSVDLYAAENAITGISRQDLRDGIVIQEQSGSIYQKSGNLAEPYHFPVAPGSQDQIFILKTLDQLDSHQVDSLLTETARVLAPDGILVGTSRLWYGTEDHVRDLHKHRGFWFAYTPQEIERKLKHRFPFSEMIEVHRTMGPMGPFIVFFASFDSERLLAEDMKRIIKEIRNVASEFSANELKMYLKWSKIYHTFGKRNRAVDYALKAIQRRPYQFTTWKTLIRSLVGRKVWDFIRIAPDTM